MSSRQDIKGVYGIATEANPLDITTNKPNSLQDCLNVTSTEHLVVRNRQGMIPLRDLYSVSGGNTDYTFTQMFVDPTLAVSDQDQSNLLITRGANSSVDTGIIWSAGSGDSQTVVAYSNGSASAMTSGLNAAHYTRLDGATDTPFYGKARFLLSKSRSHLTAGNGLFSATYTTSPEFKRSLVPHMKRFNPLTENSTSLSEDNRWFQTGYKVSLVALVKEQVGDAVYLRGIPTEPVDLYNPGLAGLVRLTGNASVGSSDLAIFNTNLPLDRGIIEIYRTKQFKATEVRPTQYFKCMELTTTDALLTSSGGFTFLSATKTLDLILNDDALQVQEILYTDLSAGDGIGGRSALPPVCSDAINFKNYAAYSNILRAPFSTITFTAVPAANDKLQAGLYSNGSSAVTVALDSKANSTTAPSTDGIMDSTETTFQGVPNQIYPLVIRPIDPVVTSSTYDDFKVPFYARILTTGTVTVTGTDTVTINTGAAVSSNFDLNKFPETGVLCISQGGATGNTGKVKLIVTYQSRESTGTAINFKGSVAFGDADLATAVSRVPTGTEYFAWYLPGSTAIGSECFAIGTVGAGATGFSLLPTYAKYPTVKAMQDVVGVTTKYAYNAGTGQMEAYIAFLGINNLPITLRLEASARQFVKDFNEARTTVDQPYATYNAASPGSIIFESFVVGGYHNGTSNIQFRGIYVAGYNNTSGTDLSGLRLNIPVSKTSSTPTNTTFNNLWLKNGLMFSRLGLPDNCYLGSPDAVGGYLYPIKVGADNRSILRIAVSNGVLYIFKDQEGVYRLDVSEGLNLPQLTQVIAVNKTVWCIAPESVVEMEGAIYFLSNVGFVRLKDDQIDVLEDSIYTDIAQLTANSTSRGDLLNVVGWGNTQRGLYGCYFRVTNSFDQRLSDPGAGMHYVYHTRTDNWFRWEYLDTIKAAITNPYTGALHVLSEEHRLNSEVTTTTGINVALITLGNTGKNWTLVRSERINGSLFDPTVRYDHLIPLTGSTLTFGSGVINITRYSATPTTHDFNIHTVTYRLRNKQLWYKTAAGVYYRATITNVIYPSSATSKIVISLEGITGNFPFTPGTGDFLVIGVDSSLTFNRYYLAGGSNLVQWQEVQAHTGAGISLDGLTMSFKGENSSDFSTPIVFSASSDLFRTLVDRNSARGRWMQAKVTHNRPSQDFKVNGFSIIFGIQNTFRTKKSGS